MPVLKSLEKNMKNQKGYTLIEAMIVFAIICILSATVIGAFI